MSYHVSCDKGSERGISTATVVCSGEYLWKVFQPPRPSCKRMTLLWLTTVGADRYIRRITL